jgi:4-hydroxy-tetrahydrodipicolinate synthase
MTTLSGVWLPIVTPFHDGAVDFGSYEKLIDHYITAGVSGIFPLGTTGESPTLDDDECEALVERTLGIVAARVPVFIGVGGNSTAKTLKTLRRLDHFDFAGIVSVCPYITTVPRRTGCTSISGRSPKRPTVRSSSTTSPTAPASTSRTTPCSNSPSGRTFVGVKDSSGNIAQSIELLRRRPAGFAVMTGEDNYYYTMLAHGGDGGILASAHLETAAFVAVYERMLANDHRGARRIWSGLETVVPLLFREANPMPIKYCLWRQGLLRSPECRLPLTRVSPELAAELDRAIGHR